MVGRCEAKITEALAPTQLKVRSMQLHNESYAVWHIARCMHFPWNRVLDLLPVDVRTQLQRLFYSEESERSKLPVYIRKLISGYDLDIYQFEIFECIRKLMIVCVPVLFVPAGSTSPLTSAWTRFPSSPTSTPVICE